MTYRPEMGGKTLFLEEEDLEEIKSKGHTIVITAHGDEVWLEKVGDEE